MTSASFDPARGAGVGVGFVDDLRADLLFSGVPLDLPAFWCFRDRLAAT
jgi:hypothetical protein